jgi:hypothetical protein
MPEGQPTPERFQTPRRMSESIIRLVQSTTAAQQTTLPPIRLDGVGGVGGGDVSEGVDPPSPRQA